MIFKTIKNQLKNISRDNSKESEKKINSWFRSHNSLASRQKSKTNGKEQLKKKRLEELSV